MMSVLFVDDEPRVLDGLRRQLREQRQAWEMRFVDSGEAALAALQEQHADVIVSDMRMPGMGGGELLRKVMMRYPGTVRIAFSGQTDQADLVADMRCIHQYLQKPCDTRLLVSAVNRTTRLAARVRTPQLRAAVTKIASLPPRNESYRKLCGLLRDENADIGVVTRLVEHDPALTAKLLQMVNSAFFACTRKVTTARAAISMLGLRTLHSIVMVGNVFDGVAGGSRPEIEEIWHQSVQLGALAKRLAHREGAPIAVQEDAGLAAMLSLIGRVILMTADPDRYGQVGQLARDERLSLSAAELRVFDVPQQSLGAYALGVWAFPDEVCETVAYHARPSESDSCDGNTVIRYVHLARCQLSAMGASNRDVLKLDTKFAPPATKNISMEQAA